MYGDLSITTLIGKTMKTVEQHGDELHFITEDGEHFRFYHSQDCCESVDIESITGDLADLLGAPILLAEEATSENVDPDGYTPPDGAYYRESFTWTFYKFATIKGYVDVRWYGTSNGYYSERVSFDRA